MFHDESTIRDPDRLFDNDFIYNIQKRDISYWVDNGFLTYTYDRVSFSNVQLGAFFNNSIRSIVNGGGSVSVSQASSDAEVLESLIILMENLAI